MNSFPLRLSLIALAGTVFSLLDPGRSHVGAQDFSRGALIQMTDFAQPVPDEAAPVEPSLSDVEGPPSTPPPTEVQDRVPIEGDGLVDEEPWVGGMSAACNSCQISPFWGSAEYMMMWGKRRYLPPLITTGPVGSDGILGQPGVVVVFGDALYEDQLRSGGRIKFGHWLGGCDDVGVVGSFYGVGESVVRFDPPANGLGVVARPFFSVDLDQQASLLVNNPGEWSGFFTDASNTNEVLGAECYVRKAMYKAPGYRVDVIGGYQFNRIDDGLRLASTTTALTADTFPVGTRFDVEDRFDAQNQFHGGTLGLLTEVCGNRLRLEMLAKIGLGNMHERVNISGNQIIASPGETPVVNEFGLLAQPSNIGEYNRDTFAVAPEAGVKLGYQVASGLELSVGYSFLYWSDAAMAGTQVDTTIDLGGGTRPTLDQIRENDYWVQGLTLGVDWEF